MHLPRDASLAALAVALRGRALFTYARMVWPRALFAGALSFVAYGLVLWAMTRASIGGISALRETSVVFAALIGITLLGDRALARRMAGALTITIGAIMLKLA